MLHWRKKSNLEFNIVSLWTTYLYEVHVRGNAFTFYVIKYEVPIKYITNTFSSNFVWQKLCDSNSSKKHVKLSHRNWIFSLSEVQLFKSKMKSRIMETFNVLSMSLWQLHFCKADNFSLTGKFCKIKYTIE